ncbi:endoribonuclease Dcr-1 [Diorhabda sublineata]|uniref:endoribonuclease Dcr-1 n=1 Tax=Diorhabda sublineata TaxID=1163346 RepID=UPI0024E15662|nr:endoribonuclease Dcr-1 [Diorhabda sublineata]
MSSFTNESVYTHTFTPKEYQVELLESAKKKNTIICSSTSSSKAFIVVKLLQEYSWQMRQEHGKKALFILDPQNVPIMTSHVKYLTDLKCISITRITTEIELEDLFQRYQVIISTAEICIEMVHSCLIADFSVFNLLVIDDCLYGQRQSLIKVIMNKYNNLPEGNKPRILGLTTGLLSSELQPDRLEAELSRLEKLLNSDVDTSSEIVTLIRLSCRPHETVIECPKSQVSSLQNEIKKIVQGTIDFLHDHRYDPSEIYDDDLLEEFKQVPDPRIVPLELLHNFLEILEDMGPWCADKAALYILSKIEKLKVKVPYERHYLLLCMTSSTLISVRATCESLFENSEELDILKKYSTQKVLKFIEILKQFKPPGDKPPIKEKSPDESSPVKFKGRCKGPRRPLFQRPLTEDNLCSLIFVHNGYKAKTLFALLCTLSQQDPDFWWISALFTVEKVADTISEPKEAENEHKTQEEVLKKFRCHECNILVSTSVLEQGCDLPKCNLVIRFDLPKNFHSYIQSKARARASDAHYILFANIDQINMFVEDLAEYNEVENTLLRRCYSLEPNKQEEIIADLYSHLCTPYKPLPDDGAPSITLTNAISLLNKYCAKLPSDTFTRLTPIWSEEQTSCGKFVVHLRLPINSPVKQTISSPPMPNSLLARRAVAFMVCRQLHKTCELDDYLQPINKENFKATEDDWVNFALDEPDDENLDVRPGTTKRRQYYNKRIADALLNCHPVVGEPTYFYKIVMTLTCPLPEEQNTRGREIYPPEDSPLGFGILTSKRIPKISAFPIFTRSGEVSVDLELISTNLVLTEEQIKKTREFVNYTFTSVLRLQKYLMLFNPDASSNNYLIVPTIKRDNAVKVNWKFINLIFTLLNRIPAFIPDEKRANYIFNPELYRDAVVMPWYRNQDQPQYFYVAEMCSKLNPTSAFPGLEYATFEEYYKRKYGIQIQNLTQCLLDVDHTSARLNFLTPRYVNRKGVALPTSSEETKRAKRENLEQKQILVPELCAIHPFPASLWRKAVALPCILYRINALLLADQIRRTVASALNLGICELPKEVKWPSLNFGWNLSDVLKKSREEEMRKQQEKLLVAELHLEEKLPSLKITEIKSDDDFENGVNDTDDECNSLVEISTKCDDKWIEIGTWSNEMAGTMECNGSSSLIRYASPTSWLQSDNNYDDFSDSESEILQDDSDSEWGGLRIEFTGDNQAEALDDEDDDNEDKVFKLYNNIDAWKIEEESVQTDLLRKEFHEACSNNKHHILSSGILVTADNVFDKTILKDKQDKIVYTNNIDKNVDFSLLYKDNRNNSVLDENIISNQYINEYDISEELSFSFDEQPNLADHPGPSPNVLLQALTMSNANDGINLERLETIGDSFLKYAITNYLYSKYENVHEGKLSHLRSKQVSNLNLYRLGRRKCLGEFMIATKFDPHDNWLPPCFYVPKQLEEALIDAQYPANCWSVADMAATRNMSLDDICVMVRERGEGFALTNSIPYNLVTQHSIPDKSIADCVEAVIGAYLIECGPRGALLFMAWLGIRVLPKLTDGTFGEITLPRSPLLRNIPDPEGELERQLDGYDKFEKHIGYKFRDRSYLLQAMTHASYFPNHLTDCYQRLEFLGDAVLDYLITRHLYEDPRMHSPGALTDLRSALVNNTIFASLAVRNNFHKYFKHLSPGLNEVVERFIRLQEESGHSLVDELYLVIETECEEVEDVEVPKALGDVFESVAGAIFLDSGMSLDAVWKVYYRMMKSEIEQFSNKVPKSPIRELLELEPETAKFGKPEKLADGRRVRVTVEVFGKGLFKGIGRNYRIAKCTAAKCALKHLKRRGLLKKSDN